MSIDQLDADIAREEAAEERRAARAEARQGPAFELVDDLPDGGPGRRPISACRREFAAAALANPMKWLKYTPGDRDVVVKASTLQSAVRAHRAPFENPGLEAVLRDKQLYLRYNPAADQ